MPEKCALTILELNWNQPLGQDKIEHLSCTCSRRPHNCRSFHVIERTRTSSKCQKMKNARAKILFFIVKYLNLWGFCGPRRRGCLTPREELFVFAYQIWKPQFLSLVQFPFDNCHLPFSPTTFFEVGVYNDLPPNKNLEVIPFPKIINRTRPWWHFECQAEIFKQYRDFYKIFLLWPAHQFLLQFSIVFHDTQWLFDSNPVICKQ